MDLTRYVNLDSPWKLVKLHGSVDWGRRVSGIDLDRATWQQCSDESVASLLDDVDDLELESAVQKRPSFMNRRQPTPISAGKNRYDLFYPALAPPLGSDKSPQCPPEHVEVVSSFIEECTDFLTIGFSARDDDVLALLNRAQRVKKLCVVSAPEPEVDRIARAISRPAPEFRSLTWQSEAGNGFSRFVSSNGLQKFLADRS